MSEDIKNLNRRSFLKIAGIGAAATAVAVNLPGCKPADKNAASPIAPESVPTDKMTYRTNPKNGDKVSLLGFGCMRLPTVNKKSARDTKDEPLDQEMLNRQVDFALSHGVNYFDTSPAYCQGRSEHAMGIALSRHPRDSYYIATKLSNFAEEKWDRESSIEMYKNSFKELQVDYIDYMLLHGIGMGEDGMAVFEHRYMENGILDFLLEERKAGKIRNLGFSYHGDIKVFDHLLSKHDIYQWDFVQIQLNYVDWKHAKEVNERNTNAEYLYNELHSRNIPIIIMEPLLGGRLAKLNFKSIEQLKRLDPKASIASWAFRYAGNPDGVLTVLSGMTYIENLYENITTYSPLKPLTPQELEQLEEVARTILEFQLIQCNECQYCMPCPYGLDIPAIFSHYNKCLNEGLYAKNIHDENYRRARQAFLVGYDRHVPKLRQADHCIGCNQCGPHCPQRLDIPKLMTKVDKYVEYLKRNPNPSDMNS